MIPSETFTVFVAHSMPAYFEHEAYRLVLRPQAEITVDFLVASDYNEAVELFEKNEKMIDLFFFECCCDQEGFIFNGLIEEVKNHRPDLNVIALSNSVDWQQKCLEMGADEAINSGDFEKKIREAINNLN